MNPIRSILRGVTRKEGDSLNIIVFPYDGRFEALLSEIPNNYYAVPDLTRFPWQNGTIDFPENFQFLPSIQSLPINVDFDLVICNDTTTRFPQGVTQFQAASQVSHMLHLPLVVIEHFHPQGTVRIEDLEILRETQKQNIHISVSEAIGRYWNIGGRTINYGIKVPNLKDKNNNILLVGEFPQQDYRTIANIVEGYKVLIVGNNQGFSNPLPDQQLDEQYQSAGIYLNLPTFNNIPIPLLKAMAAGCSIVSNTTPALSEILEHKKNCLIGKSVGELKAHISYLSNNKEYRELLGRQARQTILDKFPHDMFIKKWNEVFEDMSSVTYTR